MARQGKTKTYRGTTVYHTWGHNVDGCLRNGSFVRTRAGKHVQYMNGDNMGVIDAIPSGMIVVDTDKAERLVPDCVGI